MGSMASRMDFSAHTPQEDFDYALKEAAELGVWPTSRYGLSSVVLGAIRDVAGEYPDVSPDSVKKAHDAFAASAIR